MLELKAPNMPIVVAVCIMFALSRSLSLGLD